MLTMILIVLIDFLPLLPRKSPNTRVVSPRSLLFDNTGGRWKVLRIKDPAKHLAFGDLRAIERRVLAEWRAQNIPRLYPNTEG